MKDNVKLSEMFKVMVANSSVRNFLGGKFSGGQFSSRQFSSGSFPFAVFRGGSSFLKGSLPGEVFQLLSFGRQGGSFPGEDFPRTL